MLPHCYKDSESVQPFLQKAETSLPFHMFEPILTAYKQKDQMFKSVALTHLKNYLKKAVISKEEFQELLRLLDTFRDPYQDFIEERCYRTWDDTKTNLLGGIII